LVLFGGVWVLMWVFMCLIVYLFLSVFIHKRVRGEGSGRDRFPLREKRLGTSCEKSKRFFGVNRQEQRGNSTTYARKNSIRI
jgi:hypothetical protein